MRLPCGTPSGPARGGVLVGSRLETGREALDGEFPHGLGGADDVIAMPWQCSTQWDGLGHIFEHGRAWNGRDAGAVVTSADDLVTGIETAADRFAGRGVLLDVGRNLGPSSGEGAGELPDGFAITTEHLERTIAAQGVRLGRGDMVCVRTGHNGRTRRQGWGTYAGGPAPGLSFTTAEWLHSTEIAALATDTWGFDVRPNEFDVTSSPCTRSPSRTSGCRGRTPASRTPRTWAPSSP